MKVYGELCAHTLAAPMPARATGSPWRPTSATTRPFDKALARFAESYADQNERDYEAFAAACKSGRLHAEEGM